MVIAVQTVFVWFVWSERAVSWCCMAVSERRELIDGLHQRFASFVEVPSCVAVASSAEDDEVEAAGRKLPWPEGFSWLQHERYGVS